MGGIRQQVQTFHAAVSEVGNGLLLVAGFGLLIPSAFYSALKGSAIPQSEPHRHHSFTDKKLEHDILGISRITSILLIIAFGMSVATPIMYFSRRLIILGIFGITHEQTTAYSMRF